MANQKSLILGKVDQQKGNDEEGEEDVGKNDYPVFQGYFTHEVGHPNWDFPDSRDGQKYQSAETIE